MPFAATWMDLESIILSQVRKRKTRKYVRKYDTNQHIYKTKTDAQIYRTDLRGKKMELKQSGFLTSEYTIKLQLSRQYGTSTKTEI